MEKNSLHKTSVSVIDWFRDQILTRKLASPLGLLLLGCLSIVMAYATVLVSVKVSIGITAAVCGLLVCALSVMYPWLGFVISFFVCFFLLLPSRLTNVPIVLPTGMIPEFFSYLTLLG